MFIFRKLFFFQGPPLLSYFGILRVTVQCALCHSVIISAVIQDKLI